MPPGAGRHAIVARLAGVGNLMLFRFKRLAIEITFVLFELLTISYVKAVVVYNSVVNLLTYMQLGSILTPLKMC